MESPAELDVPLLSVPFVAFPGDEFTLRISETKLRQLVHEADQNQTLFASSCLFGDEIAIFGTLCRLVRIQKIHDDGSLDAVIRGEHPIRILHVHRSWQGRLFAGASAIRLPSDESAPLELTKRMAATALLVRELLPENVDGLEPGLPGFSWKLGQAIGLSSKQKVRLLSIPSEEERGRFLLTYLTSLLPELEKVVRAHRA